MLVVCIKKVWISRIDSETLESEQLKVQLNAKVSLTINLIKINIFVLCELEWSVFVMKLNVQLGKVVLFSVADPYPNPDP